MTNEAYMTTKVLVTGGKGFIGRVVCATLTERRYVPVTLDRDNGDIRYLEDIQRVGEGAQHVIHLAGVLGTHELFDTPQLAIDVNITGSKNVLEFCRRNGASYTGITMPAVFPSLYTATKLASGAFATAYHESFGVPVSHVRAFNAFGPGQAHGQGHPQKIVPTFATKVWRDEPIPIWGDGTQTVDLVHTDDLAKMLVDAMLYGNNEVFDGGTGTPHTVLGLASVVSALAGKRLNVEHLPMRRGETPTHIVATGEGWDKLGWKPEFRSADLFNAVESYKP